jgi:antibiotic biosynthesis monooxygenase (ABM) superfamily enzyme
MLRKEDNMLEKRTIYIVGVTITPEYEEEFKEWYDNIHLPMALKSKLVDKITWYKRAPITEGDQAEYLTICEFKDRDTYIAWRSSPEMQAALAEQEKRWSGKDWREVKFRAVYETPVHG